MSRAEKFIQDCTRNCSNEILRNGNESFTNIPFKGEYNPWLTPDQARRAVEIAKEEIYEWLRDNIFEDKYLDLRKMGIEYAFYGYKVDTLINDLKQAMKDE
jgi:hypothetical protein